jgi:hypothetical protein
VQHPPWVSRPLSLSCPCRPFHLFPFRASLAFTRACRSHRVGDKALLLQFLKTRDSQPALVLGAAPQGYAQYRVTYPPPTLFSQSLRVVESPLDLLLNATGSSVVQVDIHTYMHMRRHGLIDPG